MEQIKLGDTPEQLGQITAADAMMVDGKIVTRQQVVELMAERDALAAQVDSLLDDRKAFVKKEFQLLKEIERIEIELKKRDEQSAALAAQVEALRSALDECAEEFELNGEHDNRVYTLVKVALVTTPQQHLSEVRAEAGRAGFIAGAVCARHPITPTAPEIKATADQYAKRVKDGK